MDTKAPPKFLDVIYENVCHDDVMFRVGGWLNLMVHEGYSLGPYNRQEMTAVLDGSKK